MVNPEMILVVGTTSDYIDWIRRIRPGGALFITDPPVRQHAEEPAPGPDEELLTDLSDPNGALAALAEFLGLRKILPAAVACFDCESMALAALIAEELSLAYPSLEAVGNCRDKSLSKRIWQEAGVPCPRSAIVRSEDAAARFFREEKGSCVLKPLSGSGSELVFRCDDEQECRRAFRELARGLGERSRNRLFNSPESAGPAVLAETFIRGEEFSCDFVLDNGQASIIRLARKIPDENAPFGTTGGYVVPGELPPGTAPGELRELLARSAGLLGITRSICMVDFLVGEGGIFLLELSPRPGGDCLPHLLRSAHGMDMLSLALDFAGGREVRPPEWENTPPHAGLRLSARRSGILQGIDASRLTGDPRVCELHLSRKQGHRITLPPEDYDTRWLGHVIFRPHGEASIETQCSELLSMVTIDIIEEGQWITRQ